MTGLAPARSQAKSVLQRALPSTLLFGALAAAILALRIVQRGELWLDRTAWLVGLAALGGAAAAALTRLALRLLPWRGLSARPRLLAALAFPAFFMATMLVAYVAHSLLIGNPLEPKDGRPIWAYVWIPAQISALFLISSPTYLLPWPLPVLSLAAAWLLPGPAATPLTPANQPGNSRNAG